MADPSNSSPLLFPVLTFDSLSYFSSVTLLSASTHQEKHQLFLFSTLGESSFYGDALIQFIVSMNTFVSSLISLRDTRPSKAFLPVQRQKGKLNEYDNRPLN